MCSGKPPITHRHTTVPPRDAPTAQTSTGAPAATSPLSTRQSLASPGVRPNLRTARASTSPHNHHPPSPPTSAGPLIPPQPGPQTTPQVPCHHHSPRARLWSRASGLYAHSDPEPHTKALRKETQNPLTSGSKPLENLMRLRYNPSSLP